MKKIALVVDDMADMRDLVREYLIMAGYDVITASGYIGAVEIMMNNSDIALVITDNDMPNENQGLEVIKQARMALSKTTKVWLMSGLMTPTKAHTAIALGANKALGKTTELVPALMELMSAEQVLV